MCTLCSSQDIEIIPDLIRIALVETYIGVWTSMTAAAAVAVGLWSKVQV